MYDTAAARRMATGQVPEGDCNGAPLTRRDLRSLAEEVLRSAARDKDLAWFAVDAPDQPLDCENVCLILGLDVDYVRRLASRTVR